MIWRALVKISETAAGLSALLVTVRHLLGPSSGLVAKLVRLGVAAMCLGLAVVAVVGLLKDPEKEDG